MSVLIVAAHPDDEVLGCGGTITRLAEDGKEVHVALLADGVLSRSIPDNSRFQKPEIEKRREAAKRAGYILSVSSIEFAEFPDNRMDSVDLLDIVKEIEALIARHRPNILLTHHAGDLNVDHRRVHEAVVTACRPQYGQPVRTLLFFEVPSSTEWQPPGSGPVFQPNWYVNIAATLDRKLAALEAYAEELRPWPHPRSRKGVEHLARWRGATVGTEAAEAFILGRNLVW